MSKAVIFDLDGTLVDTAADLIDSLNFVLAGRHLRSFDKNDASDLIGQGSAAMLQRAFATLGVDVTDIELRDAHELFLEHYASGMPGKSTVYPDVHSCLERLRASDYKLIVGTNKNEALARKLLERLGLAIHFSSLVGGDTFSTRKPAGEFILKALSTVGVDRANAVMVGDSANDILAARNAEIPSICVSFGYADPSDLLTGDAVIDNFSELDPSVIERLLAK